MINIISKRCTLATYELRVHVCAYTRIVRNWMWMPLGWRGTLLLTEIPTFPYGLLSNQIHTFKLLGWPMGIWVLLCMLFRNSEEITFNILPSRDCFSLSLCLSLSLTHTHTRKNFNNTSTSYLDVDISSIWNMET